MGEYRGWGVVPEEGDSVEERDLALEMEMDVVVEVEAGVEGMEAEMVEVAGEMEEGMEGGKGPSTETMPQMGRNEQW